MKFIAIALVIISVYAEEMHETKEYTDYLKKHVDWEVMEYEENVFRGLTVEEGKMLLGAVLPDESEYIPPIEIIPNMPSSLSWKGANCDHGVRNQGNCGSCWAFATTGMLSDRCCLGGKDHGWLAPQELVSCDKKSHGCNGGWCTYALDYVKSVKGLVPESCYSYRAANVPCPTKCADGKAWAAAHVCNCPSYKTCASVSGIQSCLHGGPVTVAFGVCNSFFSYKSGIYKCDCGGKYAGLHAVLAVGYNTSPQAHWHVRNSWGTGWGIQGYFDIGVNECGISGSYPNGNVACDKVE